MSTHPTVDPGKFRTFCLRGAGRENFVISAERKENGERVVWRFSREQTNGSISIHQNSQLVHRYMSEIISPLLDEDLIIDRKLVIFKMEDLHHLAKIPSLGMNTFVESFEDLIKLPASLSSLLLMSQKNVPCVLVIQMADATQIPLPLRLVNSKTITVEIKPKQGFIPYGSMKHCTNCVIQLEKFCNGQYSTMYKYCPLDLFSGEESRTCYSLRELFRNPRKNLKVFIDGILVSSNELNTTYHELDETLFKSYGGNLEDIITAVAYVLTKSSVEKFSLDNTSVLGQILRAQKIHKEDLHYTYQTFTRFESDIQKELPKLPISNTNIANTNDSRLSLIERSLLSATFNDCSIMITLQDCPILTTIDQPIVQIPSGKEFFTNIYTRIEKTKFFRNTRDFVQ